MASLAEKYPDCAVKWPDFEGNLIPSVDFECVWRHMVREGDRVFDKVADLEGRKVTRVFTFDGGGSLVKVKGAGWFAIPKEHVAVRRAAEHLAGF